MSGLDDKAVFAALQSELNSRISTRASINTAHLQTVVALVAGFIAARAVKGDCVGTSERIEFFSYYLAATIPFISVYFVSLYKHNDIQIGLLNLALKRIEARSWKTLPDSIRFYKVGGDFRASFEARKVSHRAVIGLCCVSPILVLGGSLGQSATELGTSFLLFLHSGHHNVRSEFWFLVLTMAVSMFNVATLVQLQSYRNDLMRQV